MRGQIVLLLVVASLCGALTGGQESTPKPRKVLTPEQVAYQREYKAWFAHHQELQASAKSVFDAEMTRERTGDCRDASSNFEFTECFGRQADAAEQSLKSFEGSIRELLVPAPQMSGERPAIGPGGPGLASGQAIAEFDALEQSWRAYLEAACSAAFHQFDGGTGGPSFQAECKLKLTRNHMRELDIIYGNDLHL